MQNRAHSKGMSSATENNRPKLSHGLWPFVFSAALLAIPSLSPALQVSPTYQVFEAKAGGRVKGQMTLTNNEQETVTITPDIKEWFKLTVNENINVGDWLKLDSFESFNLAPNESKLITYTLAAPKKAKGELVGAISFETLPKANMIKLQLTVVQYLSIKGTEKSEVRFDGLAVDLSTTTRVGVRLFNEGNVHVRPRGYILIDNDKGQRVTNVEVLTGQPAFPGKDRIYVGEVKGYRLPPGGYSARVEFEDVDRPVKYRPWTKKFTVGTDGKVDVR